MATHQNTAYYDSSTLAHFCAWAEGFGAAFTAFGWVQTADTGQVDWPTFSSGGTVPTTAGVVYEVWGMADTLQATAPIYMIISYYASGNNSPQMDITVCHATNGTGGASGNYVYFSGSCYSNFHDDSSFSNLWNFCGSTNRFLFVSLYQGANPYRTSGTFFIERSHDTTGADTGDYVTILGVRNSQVIFQECFFKSGAQMPQESKLVTTFPTFQGSGGGTGIGANILAAPVIPLIGGSGNPCLNVLVFDQNDFTNGSSFTCTFYGGSHTYNTWVDTSTTNSIIAAYQYTGLAYRWE